MLFLFKGKPRNNISEEELKLLQSCEILVVDPNLVVDYDLIDKLPNLRWMQSLWAGEHQVGNERK